MQSNQYIEKIRTFNRYYANVLGRIDQEIYNQPFPLTEARVITELHIRNGCTATEVREKLGIDRGYMSRIIQRFEEEKIIQKEQSQEDKRQYLLYLTPTGERFYSELVKQSTVGVRKMIQGLSNNELEKLVNSMETIESISAKERKSEPEIVIRPFKAGDVGYIAYLHGKLYDETYKFGKMFEYYVMEGLSEFMLDSTGGELWIAEVDGEIAGSIAITKSSDTVAQLRWFVLNHPYQGLGLGNKLMQTALSFCKENNYQHVFLWTVSSLDTARYLYQKYDFKLTEEKPNIEWAGERLVEERWDLDMSKLGKF